MSRRRTVSVALLCAALAAPLPACHGPRADDRTGPAERDPVEVHTAEVRMLKRPSALTLDGTLVADEESSVTSIVSGRVVAVHVERGSKVEAGAPLVDLRDVDYRLQAKAAKAQVDQARARLGMGKRDAVPKATELPDVQVAQSDMELAESDLKRTEKLAADGILSEQELETARTRAASARERYQSAINSAQVAVSSLQAARTTLEQAATSADETVVRAPFAGEIADRMVSVGEYVSPQSPLLTLVRTDPLRIELSVPQQHLRDVQPGQKVTLVVDALPDQAFEATVRYVSASVNRDTRALSVEAIVPNANGVLRPGLFATARLQTGGEELVAEVPATAVHIEAGVARVFVIVDEVVQERVVSITERTSETVTIAEGLADGDIVATDSLEKLADGVQVVSQGESN
jgi:membrane fusion protein (multidrug efflux system)